MSPAGCSQQVYPRTAAGFDLVDVVPEGESSVNVDAKDFCGCALGDVLTIDGRRCRERSVFGLIDVDEGAFLG